MREATEINSANSKMIEKFKLGSSHQMTMRNPPLSPHHHLIRMRKFAAVKYMECLKNHAAAIGGSATDGCGEFMAGGEEGTLEALLCSACNCHRNFHRKVPTTVYVEAAAEAAERGGRKRLRSKFSQEQKEKMQRFAEKSGWKIHNADDGEVRSFCEEVGVNRKVLKVWMHNNKFTNHLSNATTAN